MEGLTYFVGLMLAVFVGLFMLYLIFRLCSYAILSSIEDIKERQRRKKHGTKNNGFGGR